MLSLTRILLHNWHRFHHNVIDIEDSLYLTGHNGSGKSSILDALQLVLVADLQQIHFNSSAQDRSTRSLDTYVRGKVGENRWLRPGNTVAYIALEFCDEDISDAVTLGVCIEAGEGKTPERTYFILSERLDDRVFISEGRALPRRELKQVLRKRRGAQPFDQVGEYRDEMLNRLGGLNDRFFDLFLRALTFQPIRNVPEFVERWLLEARPLDVEVLQNIKERINDLNRAREDVEQRLAELQTIVNRQNEVRRLRDLFTAYTILAASLRVIESERQIAHLDEEISQRAQKIEQGQREQEQVAAVLKGTRADLDEARFQLRQSDVIRRRNELQDEIGKATAQVSEIRTRWDALRRDLTREAETITPLLDSTYLDEKESLRALLAAIGTLTADEPPPDSLEPLLMQVVQVLDAALTRAQEEEFRLRQQIQQLRERGDALEQELEQLRRQRRLYPKEVERLRDLLTPLVGERPPLLCEKLEIPDARWQNAVEALLGPRRFTIIVPPQHFDAALVILDRARAEEKLYDARLLDLAKAQSEARPARERSLARQVVAPPELRGYVDTILGDIITCEAVAELREHRHAVTPEVVVYSEWTVRAIPPNQYQPWFVGERAQASQIEMREGELENVRAQFTQLVSPVQAVQSQIERFKHGRELSNARQRLELPLDERPLRAQIEDWHSELRALDFSSVEQLDREVRRLEEIVKREEELEKSWTRQIATWESEKRGFEHGRVSAQRELDERKQQADQARAQYPSAIQSAEELLAERLEQDIATAIRNTDSAARNFETRSNNELDELIQNGTAYNTRYGFAARPDKMDGTRYADERTRLNATDLPRYKSEIEQARREADEELREHVLHRLREQIQLARQKLDQINAALGGIDFHGEKYRFKYKAAEDVHEFYELINNAQVLGTGPLFESEFYHAHQETFDRFYEQLTRVPLSDEERAAQERLADYRSYLEYDIEVTHPDGQTSRWSKIMDQTSGGETQTPFYLTIAASFVQLYRINERSGRPTIRLVAFDEAFSKMDQGRIASTLELFQRFNLQIITATPLERCEYLAPKVSTTYVLTGVSDHVVMEPYRVYAARLEALNEA
jgi:uncharacterized protein YPO0396